MKLYTYYAWNFLFEFEIAYAVSRNERGKELEQYFEQ